jgi:hypothetical protein
LRSILSDFGFEQNDPTKLHEDSRAVIAMADNPVCCKGSRHIDTLKHFIGELVQGKLMELAPCATDLMVVDALTKGLSAPAFLKHKVEMRGMGPQVYSACVVMIYKCHIC